eukprot:TRINITY_DN1485_c0_g2_i1.p1 TRINITY_DN1485_c0_g2~~TRINITY_DN1485_c0_g2_i1.p1  ORF type:complete len:2455 (-),score=332.04 TRINITY_DN1485_c0_g2_i1:104-7468(-)
MSAACKARQSFSKLMGSLVRASPLLWWIVLANFSILLVHGDKVKICYDQEVADPENKSKFNCGREWVIFNKAVVAEFWEMEEVEFFWDDMCTVQLPVFEATASEQMTHPKWKDNKPSAAMDGDTTTHFTANCRYIMGGCLPYQAYIGVDIGNAPVRAIHHTDTYATVRCVRIFQSPNITRQALEVHLAMSVNYSGRGNRGNTEGWRWEFLESFDALGGGLWHSRPARNQGLWRLWNAVPTQKPWQVAEIIFYTDLFCTQKAIGVPIVSSSFKPDGCVDRRDCDQFIPNNLVDGIYYPGYTHPEPLPTRWIAGCSQYSGCKPEEVWLGIDFNLDPMTVKCVELFQPEWRGQETRPWTGKPHYASKLLMQTWDGYTWVNWAEYDDLYEGVWNSTVPKPYGAYRLANYDRMRGSWIVNEVAFYEEPDCGIVGAPEYHGYFMQPGDAIDGNPSMRVYEMDAACRTAFSKCPNLAFDDNPATSWHSDCSPCDQRQAWIGLHLKKPNPNVRCFRFFQSGDRAHQSAAVELSAWDGKEWVIQRMETGMGGGSWNFRPANPGSMWRLVALARTKQPWTIVALSFYQDDFCNEKVEPFLDAEPIACGNENDIRGPPEEAFNEYDPLSTRTWKTSCTAPGPGIPGCGAAAAWIGLQAYRGTFDVRCVRLFQHRHRDYQTEYAALQYWNGAMWLMSSVPTFPQLGGGAWQSLPGVRGSMWRFGADRSPKGVGVAVGELKFFLEPSCNETSEVGFEMPNFMPITSGAANGREIQDATGFTPHLTYIGDFGVADGFKAFDGDLNTFWTDLQPGWSWVGLDFTTQVADITCIKVALSGVPSLHPDNAELQGWDGKAWATKAVASNPWFATLLLPMPYISMLGWQRRAAPERSMWRIENGYRIEYWDVKEILLYGTTTCGGDAFEGSAISSKVTAQQNDKDGGHLLPRFAFDGDTSTIWRAECPPIEYDEMNEVSGGCLPGEAWIGLDIGRSVDVFCVRIMQSGLRHKQLVNATLSAWGNKGVRGATEDGWRVQMFFEGLGGDTWNVRPAQPDVLWRVTYVNRNEDVCEGNSKMPPRSWGISEIKFFTDDACEVELPSPMEYGTDIIASGSREPVGFGRRQGAINPYNPKMAFDGKENTFWAAQCGGTQESNASKCEEGMEFIGLDFTTVAKGMPVEVRCIKVLQSRSKSKVCCDPAEDLRLERWNGTKFVNATWRHLPRDDDPIKIPADFRRMGQCPIGIKNVLSSVTQEWEMRGRRQSESCQIPLSGAVQLLSNPLCEKHEWCEQAGFPGFCCPTMPAENAISRCCCNLLRKDPVFEDELDVGEDRVVLETAPVVGIEFVIIRCTNVTPFIGVIFGCIFYFLVLLPRRRDEEMGRGFYMAFCAPLHRWMQPGPCKPLGRAVAFFVVRKKGERAIRIWFKRLIGLVLVSYLGSCLIWIALSLFVAELCMRLFFLCGKLITYARSPYDPHDEADQKRRAFVMGKPIPTKSGAKQAVGGATVGVFLFSTAKGMSVGVIYAAKAAIDAVILRFAAMNIGAIQINISVPTLLLYVPALPLDIDLMPYLDQIYYIMQLSAQLFEDAFYAIFVGIPRCEGPVLMFSGMWLITITIVLIRWFNYDFFGLLAATKAVVEKTRPTFQSKLYVAYVLGLQSGMFLLMQCTLLLFSRAVVLVNVNPFQSSTRWNCPYPGEDAAIYVGRVFLVVVATVAITVTFFCANGHFLGQSYVVKAFSQRVGIPLTKLDRRQPPEGGVFRWDTMLSFIPTTFGIWIDGWNVRGYFIKERAAVYAKEMQYPEICQKCGVAHVPYHEIMRATSRQLSLAYQLIPGGALIGKGCEYINNPPLLYCGTRLACYHDTPNIDRAKEDMPKKMGCGKVCLKMNATYFCAWVQDRGVSILRRMFSIAIFSFLLYFTLSVNEDNLKLMVSLAVYVMLILTQLAAFSEFALPALMALGLLYGLLSTKRQKPSSKPSAMKRKLAIAGQVIHACVTGVAVSLFLVKEEKRFGIGQELAINIGVLCGIFEGYLVVFISWLLELCPRSRLMGAVFSIFYSACLSAAAGYGLGADQATDVKVIIAVGGIVTLLPVTGICFKPITYNGKNAERPSELKPLFRFPRFLSPLLGSTAACFAGSMPFELVVGKFGPDEALGICIGVGVIAGLSIAMLTDVVVDTRNGQIAIVGAFMCALPVGLFIHWTLGIVGGAFGGASAAMLYELWTVRLAKKQTFEDPRLYKAKVAHSSLLDPSTDLAGGDEQDVTLHSSSGKIEGWQGGWEKTASGHAGGRDPAWGGYSEFAPKPRLPIEDDNGPDDLPDDEDGEQRGEDDDEDDGAAAGGMLALQGGATMEGTELALANALQRSNTIRPPELEATLTSNATLAVAAREQNLSSPPAHSPSPLARTGSSLGGSRSLKKYSLSPGVSRGQRRIPPSGPRATWSKPSTPCASPLGDAAPTAVAQSPSQPAVVRVASVKNNSSL